MEETKIRILVDPDLLKFMPRYIQNRKEDLGHLKAFLQEKDSGSMKILSHKVRGHAKSYGLAPLGDICKKLESAINDDDVDELYQLLLDYEKYISRLELPEP